MNKVYSKLGVVVELKKKNEKCQSHLSLGIGNKHFFLLFYMGEGKKTAKQLPLKFKSVVLGGHTFTRAFKNSRHLALF